MISTSNREQARKEIKKLNSENKPIIIKTQDDSFNRKILEYGKFDILLFPPSNKQYKDKAKQLDSGLNHVLAEIATKDKIAIGFDLEEIRNLKREEKAKILARIKQNIKICRKAKTSLVLLNYQDKKDAFSLLISLGASTEQVSFVK